MPFDLHAFSLVLIQHPATGKFVAVDESCGRGIWIAGGHVESGESFEVAAVREAQEEAGCDIVLKGVLRVETSISGPATMRCRIIFYAQPRDPSKPLKSVPDEESNGAFWADVEELRTLQLAGKLRGDEIISFASYVASGGAIYPMSMLGNELDEPHAASASHSFTSPARPAPASSGAGGAAASPAATASEGAAGAAGAAAPK